MFEVLPLAAIAEVRYGQLGLLGILETETVHGRHCCTLLLTCRVKWWHSMGRLFKGELTLTLWVKI
jgi:hypothetical protein